eukprot:1559173-Amphidinium_carterae.1
MGGSKNSQPDRMLQVIFFATPFSQCAMGAAKSKPPNRASPCFPKQHEVRCLAFLALVESRGGKDFFKLPLLHMVASPSHFSFHQTCAQLLELDKRGSNTEVNLQRACQMAAAGH